MCERIARLFLPGQGPSDPELRPVVLTVAFRAGDFSLGEQVVVVPLGLGELSSDLVMAAEAARGESTRRMALGATREPREQ